MTHAQHTARRILLAITKDAHRTAQPQTAESFLEYARAEASNYRLTLVQKQQLNARITNRFRALQRAGF